LACFCGLGTVYTFGYWVPALIDEFGGSNAQTQVILASLNTGFFLGGIPGRAMLHRCGFRAVYAAGGFASSLAFLGVSFAHSLWGVYTICIASAGMQASWMVSGALIPRHMPPKEATRYGAFAVIGSGIGIMCWSSLARVMEPALGWRVSFRVMSASFAVLYSLGALFQKPPEPIPEKHRPSDSGYWWLLCDPRCQLMFVAQITVSLGYMLTFAVQGIHARSRGMSMGDVATAYTMFGAFSVAGRIGAGIVGGWVNPLYVWGAAKVGIAAAVALVAFARDSVELAMANALLGLASGPMIALLVPALRQLVGAARIPEALVLVMALQTLTALPSPALAGLLADVTGSYFLSLLFGACSVLFGSLCIGIIILQGPREPAATKEAEPACRGAAEVPVEDARAEFHDDGGGSAEQHGVGEPGGAKSASAEKVGGDAAGVSGLSRRSRGQVLAAFLFGPLCCR